MTKTISSNIALPPVEGIATDAAHSIKNGLTQYRGINLKTGEQIFLKSLGNQTVNIGEFLGVVEAVKYIIENNYSPAVIYTDSMTAITWYKNKKCCSKKKNIDLNKAELLLEVLSSKTDSIEVRHWNNSLWGETPADFNNK